MKSAVAPDDESEREDGRERGSLEEQHGSGRKLRFLVGEEERAAGPSAYSSNVGGWRSK